MSARLKTETITTLMTQKLKLFFAGNEYKILDIDTITKYSWPWPSWSTDALSALFALADWSNKENNWDLNHGILKDFECKSNGRKGLLGCPSLRGNTQIAGLNITTDDKWN